MRYGSLFSGIEAASVALQPLGMEPLFFSEIEPFCNALLQHHYPQIPNLGDITRIETKNLERPDLIIGGSPCQDFSISGKRAGLDGVRGGMAFEYCRVLRELAPQWFIWENVPGVLSANGGRDFAAITQEMAHLGYHLAYRILDAQYFGLAQRRKRVYVVGNLRDWRYSTAVLFDSPGCAGRPAKSRPPYKVSGTISSSGAGVMRTGNSRQEEHMLIANTLGSHASPRYDLDNDTYVTGTLGTNVNKPGQSGHEGNMLVYPTLTDKRTRSVNDPVLDGSRAVRRLTPTECERLMGFPDGYTRIEYRGKPAADSPRYRAIGNSFPVPVIRWIAQRIQRLES